MFSACFDKKLPDNSEEGVTFTLIVLDLDETPLFEKEILSHKSSLYDAFNEFEELQVRATSSFLGAFVHSVAVGEIIEDENEFGNFSYFSESAKIEENFVESRYIAVYHDMDDDTLKDFFIPNLVHSEKDFFYSGVGVSLLPLREGASYILMLAAY